ncbi:MAG: hypothetical protein AABW83_03695 [Nanoarchaeota archaeon]
MKSKIIFSLFVLFLIFISNFIIAQQEGLDAVPGGDLIKKAVNEEGEVKGISNIKDKIDNYQQSNDGKSYLWKEWTNLSFVGKFLSYIGGFFSFFNSIWKYSFGMEFIWNLIFFFHVFIWIVVICVIYFPAREIFDNRLFALIVGIVFASITGTFGIITMFVNLLDTAVRKLWWLTFIVTPIIILIIILYGNYFESSKKKSEEEELERAKGNIKTQGKSSEKFFDELGGG